MKIFVAGGTGVLGQASVKALVHAGHQVRATARNDEKAQLVRELGAEPIQVDLYDPKEVQRAVAGCEERPLQEGFRLAPPRGKRRPGLAFRGRRSQAGRPCQGSDKNSLLAAV